MSHRMLVGLSKVLTFKWSEVGDLHRFQCALKVDNREQVRHCGVWVHLYLGWKCIHKFVGIQLQLSDMQWLIRTQYTQIVYNFDRGTQSPNMCLHLEAQRDQTHKSVWHILLVADSSSLHRFMPYRQFVCSPNAPKYVPKLCACVYDICLTLVIQVRLLYPINRHDVADWYSAVTVTTFTLSTF